jgi:hypothetical protein
MKSNQLDAFLSTLPGRLEVSLPPDAPRTVFASALELTREQEDQLMLHIGQQIAGLEAEMGRNIVNEPGWWRQHASSTDNQEQDPMNSFFGKREKWDMIYAMQLEWRQFSAPIFRESNIHIPLSHRIVKQQISRAQGYFFGTDPWYTISPAGADDAETARLVDDWTKWAFNRAKIQPILAQAIAFAFIRGEALVKSTWRKQSEYYQQYAEVAIDVDGEPLVADDGDYIFPSDYWEWDETQTYRVLSRSTTTALPNWAEGDEANLVFDYRLIHREKIQFNGLDLAIPNYKDVLLSPRERSIDDAKFIAHLYSRPAIDVAGEYMAHLQRSGQADNLPKIIELLRNQGGQRRQWTAERSPRADLGEITYSPGYSGQVSSNDSSLTVEPNMEIAECYLHYDALGRGQTQNIVVLLDKANMRPIFYDYLANYAPGRPFHCVRVNPVDNRWHGQSAVEDCWQLNSSIDLQFNRINLSNQRSGYFYEMDPSVYRDFEGQPNPVNVALNGGHVYTRLPNSTGKVGFTATPIVDIKQNNLQAMIEFLTQMMTNMSGVSSSNDAQMAGLETANLATGIRHLERSNQEQFAPFIAQLSEGIEAATHTAIKLLLQNMDEKETFRYLAGNEVAVATIERANVEEFDFDLRLEISRFRAEAQSQQNLAAIAMLKDFAAQPPEVKAAIRALTLRQLRLFETPNAEMAIELLEQSAPIPPQGAPLPSAPVTSPLMAVEPSV